MCFFSGICSYGRREFVERYLVKDNKVTFDVNFFLAAEE